MSDQPETVSTGRTTGLWKWGLLGLGVASAAAAGVAIGNRGSGTEWASDQRPIEAVAAVPLPPKVDVAATLPADSPNAVRGVVNPQSEATVASRMTARIVAMPYGEGQSFPAGALLAKFDCSQIHAELNAAEAAASAYRKTYETNVELDQFEAVGKNEVAVSKANLGKATAEAAAVSAQLSDCEVRAPFAGKVVEQIAHAKEVAASGQPLLKIQSGRDVELELIIPSKWLTWVRPGASFAFVIDETGQTARGRVKRLGASVDPVSKTIRVTGYVTEATGLVLAGMSGTAKFDDARAGGGSATADASPVSAKPANGNPG